MSNLDLAEIRRNCKIYKNKRLGIKTPENEYQKQAREFLEKHGITFEHKKGNNKASWEPSGQNYSVTLQQNGKHVTFDFWGSIHDKEDGIDLDAYSVLSCISFDLFCPDEFEDFCGEFGYDTDSRKALKTFHKCASFAAQLQAFFTEEQIEDLQEIN